jgi:hypothetical protein
MLYSYSLRGWDSTPARASSRAPWIVSDSVHHPKRTRHVHPRLTRKPHLDARTASPSPSPSPLPRPSRSVSVSCNRDHMRRVRLASTRARSRSCRGCEMSRPRTSCCEFIKYIGFTLFVVFFRCRLSLWCALGVGVVVAMVSASQIESCERPQAKDQRNVSEVLLPCATYVDHIPYCVRFHDAMVPTHPVLNCTQTMRHD